LGAVTGWRYDRAVRRAVLFGLLLFFGSAAPARAAEPMEPVPPPPDPVSVAARLAVPGSPDAFFVEPRGEDAQQGEQRLILVLHARHGDAQADCAKWADVAAPHGWVLCPGGPIGTDGDRSWGPFDGAKRVIDAAVDALRVREAGRVSAEDNLLIGFSEGALVAQILGMREPERWRRWLILGGSDTYWGDDDERALSWLRGVRGRVARVVMLTGEFDPVLEHTLRAGALVRAAHIPVRVVVRRGIGHEVPEGRMAANYAASLKWLLELQ
jgi:predicted esterase